MNSLAKAPKGVRIRTPVVNSNHSALHVESRGRSIRFSGQAKLDQKLECESKTYVVQGHEIVEGTRRQDMDPCSRSQGECMVLKFVLFLERDLRHPRVNVV